MNQQDFMKLVVQECQIRSQMTYVFSKRKLKRFHKWFNRIGQKHCKWSKEKANNEFTAFMKAFKIKIDEK
ncbi:MAG: hypothetical protein GTN59_10605 [Candidatus Dadabacteria bacterium]|nr:hypothetical protein [Candidatus Dadabacteria bacterium]